MFKHFFCSSFTEPLYVRGDINTVFIVVCQDVLVLLCSMSNPGYILCQTDMDSVPHSTDVCHSMSSVARTIGLIVATHVHYSIKT